MNKVIALTDGRLEQGRAIRVGQLGIRQWEHTDAGITQSLYLMASCATRGSRVVTPCMWRSPSLITAFYKAVLDAIQVVVVTNVMLHLPGRAAAPVQTKYTFPSPIP